MIDLVEWCVWLTSNVFILPPDRLRKRWNWLRRVVEKRGSGAVLPRRSRRSSASKDEAMDELIVSVSGLRGIVGTSLTPEVAVTYAEAFLATLPPGGIVIGRDGRASGSLFADAIAAAVMAAGRDVFDAGVAATPTVGILVQEHQAAGGIQISASHNPPQYNGMKLFSAAGRVLTAEAGRTVLARFHEHRRLPLAGSAGIRHQVDGAPAHVQRVLARVDVEAIRRLRPRVWLDAGHGAGSCAARLLFEALGLEATIAGGTPDGQFEHTPEPTEENLISMLPQIAACGADVGFFQDPDADRLAVATAEGRFIGEEATLPLAVEAVLDKTRGPVVVNCSTSSMTAAIAANRGIACHVSAVGEANVVDQMLAHNAVIGGEGNGGVIDPGVVLVRDSIVGIALVLERMCASGMLTSVESLAAGLPRRVMLKKKLELGPEVRGPGLTATLNRIAEAFPQATASRLDGLRLDEGSTWVLVRASNTEPIVRIVAEGPDQSAAEAIIAKVTVALSQAGR